MAAPKPTALVVMADSTEEIELISTTDTLNRCGVDVVTASVMDGRKLVKCANGASIEAQYLLSEVTDRTFDCIALPGGMPGAEHLRNCAPLIDMLVKQKADKRLIGAICASPAVVLKDAGLLDEATKATCYGAPRFRDALKPHMVSVAPEARVVVDGNFVTSIGPGSSIEFALALGKQLVGRDAAVAAGKRMLVTPDCLP